MKYRDQTEEEKDSGLVRIGEIYQAVDSPHAELYIRVKTDQGTMAYQFMQPEAFWSRVLKWCTALKPMPECDENAP